MWKRITHALTSVHIDTADGNRLGEHPGYSRHNAIAAPIV
jgi:hypothetical protein